MGTTKKFKVTITKTLQLCVEVNAENQQQAKEIIAQRWKNSAYVLDADHFLMFFLSMNNLKNEHYCDKLYGSKIPLKISWF